jgi:hypothetical protein
MNKKINVISSNQNQTKLYQHCIQLLEQCLTKVRHKYAKGGSVGSLMDNGRIDMPIKPLTMKPMPVMQQMRTMLADGGLIDDESQIRYLISVLEGSHLNPLEQQLLLELYEDLKKLGGKTND